MRPRICFRTIWLLAYLSGFICIVDPLHAQTAAGQAIDAQAEATSPYRRVFVRESDLPVEGYRVMDLDSFRKLLEERKKREADLDPNSPTYDTELKAFHSQARLLGADLVSDRARLRWSWDPTQQHRFGIRRLLAPWSPAIDVSTRTAGGGSLNALSPPNWVYNSSGLPAIRVSSPEDWFSWTLRPQPNSTPNRLNFSLSFPRTSDSCFVLQLPKSAQVTDASVVVRSTSRWNEVTERIGDWPAAMTGSESLTELNATDSFWLLELSGREQASFSILLNPGRSLYDSPSSDDRSAPAWNRLIARQATVHTVTPHHVKSVSEWEWFEATTLDRTFRIRIPEGMRLRHVKLNDRDVSPRFSDRIVELVIPIDDTASNGPGPSSRTKVSAEFLSNLQGLGTESGESVTVPPIECLNAYVVAGTTTLAPESSIELRNISLGTGRLETWRSVDKIPERLDFSWFQSPPPVSFQVAPRTASDNAELLARLSTDSSGAVAILKLQLSPWHPSSPNRIQIGRGWSVETAQIDHEGLGLSIEEQVPGTPTMLRIDPNGPVDDRRVQIELQLSRNMSDSLDEAFEAESLIELPGRQCVEALAIEPGYASRLEYRGDYVYDLCDEETLSPWQRDRLPRLGRFLLFRMSHGKLPRLRWKKERGFFECSIDSNVRDLGDRIQVEHLFDLNFETQTSEPFEVQLAGTWRWERESDQGWKTVAVKNDTASNSWLLASPVATAIGESPRTGKVRIRALGNFDPSASTWDLPLPRLTSDKPAEHTLRVDPGLQLIPDSTRGAWSFDERGELLFTWQDPVANQADMRISVRTGIRGDQNRWWIQQSDLHVAVDSHGQQRAVIAIDAQGLRDEAWEFGLVLPDGWSVDRVVDDTPRPDSPDARDSFLVRRTAKGFLIRRQPAVPGAQSCDLEMKLVLIGPPLVRQSTSDWGFAPVQSLSFAWPRVEIECPVASSSRTLWIPHGVVVSSLPAKRSRPAWAEDQLPKIDSLWSAWHWTAEAASWLGWPESNGNDSDAISPSRTPPRDLIPSWIASDWQPAISNPEIDHNDAVAPETLALRVERSPAGPALWLVIASLMAFSLLQRAPWICLLIVGAATVAGHWLPESIAIWGRSTWVGFAVGSILYLLWWTATSSGIRPMDRHRREEPWDPWNEPGLSSDNSSDPTARAAIASSACLILSAITGLPMLAQDTASSSRVHGDFVFDVLIPLDENGMPLKDIVYIPENRVLSSDTALSDSPPPDRETYLISARHTLRFDGRSIRFGNTEQSCIHNYEVWIGEDGVGRPWRIPFSPDRSRLNRFLVDGLEVSSSRLAKSDTALTWYPERSGRRTVQIESQLRIRPSDRERNQGISSIGSSSDNRSPRAWAVETPVLPAANAILEVETDAGWSVEFNRLGRYSNPSIGKFSIQLGSQDRLSGEIATDANPTSLGAGGIASDAGGLGASEPPQINTELFIDRGQLLARTILEYPRLVDIPEEIELESDMQWQPVGNLWGDGQLIDIRPGSTLDRRRYVVRWNSDLGESPAKRMVTTTWIPVGNSNLRNVLFAECRDRRVRPNTLRYARSAGSVWTLEGINTWVPSINTKERIEWMELNERPIATSLRIPLNGGFGVLRQQAENKLQRARIAHQWGVGSSRISLRSRIEFANPINNRKNLVLSLPSNYLVSEVLSRSANLAHTSWVVGDRRWIQVFIDREIGDVGELIVVAEQEVASMDLLQGTVPLLTIEGVTVAEQFAEFSADPAWRVQWGASPLRGKGLGKSIASIDLNQVPTPESIPIERLKGEWNGELKAKTTLVSENEWRWHLQMVGNTCLHAKPTVTLSLPTEMGREWRSDAVTKELPSLDSSRRIVQIQPIWSDDQQSAAFDVEWTADPKALRDNQWLSRVRVESDPGLKCVLEKSEIDPGIATSEDAASPQSDEPGGEAESFEVHRFLSSRARPDRTLVQSSVWTDLSYFRNESPSGLRWHLPVGARVEWASINGEGVHWTQEGNQVSLVAPPLNLLVRVDLWTDVASLNDVDAPRASVPALVRSDALRRSGWIVSGDDVRELRGDRSCSWPELWTQVGRHNLEILAALHRLGASHGGTRSRWMKSLSRETRSVLLSLAHDEGALEASEYNGMVASYLAVASEGFSGAGYSWPASPHPWLPEPRPTARAPGGDITDRASNRLLATLCMGLLVVLAPWIWQTLGRPMQRNPWWPLALIGTGIWIASGTWIPALVLTCIGLALAIDSYLILNGRFRQTGTRAPR